MNGDAVTAFFGMLFFILILGIAIGNIYTAAIGWMTIGVGGFVICFIAFLASIVNKHG